MRLLLTYSSYLFQKVKACYLVAEDTYFYGTDSKSSKIKLFSIMVCFTVISLISANCFSNEGNSILILLSGNDDVYLDVATTITNSTIKQCRNSGLSCQDTNFEIKQINSTDEVFDHKYQIIVTLGIKAAIYASDHNPNSVILSALIPKNSLFLNSTSTYNPTQYYLYLDQPIYRSLLLIKSLSDRFKSVGILVNTNDKESTDILTNYANKLNLSLGIEKIITNGQIGAALNRLLLDSDVILAIPDTYIHNKATVSNILLSAYRNRIPLIGFSSAYVRAGALAAIYSSPEDIAYQVRDNIIDVYTNSGISSNNQMAKYFSIIFNSDVARSLGFPIKSVDELKDEIIKRSSDGIE